MYKYIVLALLMTLQTVARGQTITLLDSLGLPHPTSAQSLRYWIDDDAGSVTAIDDLNGKYTIDVSMLLEGLHTIHYQIIDSEGKVAAPYSGIFLILSGSLNHGEAGKLRYWFDDHTDVMTCDANAGIQTLDVSSLLDGLHTVHYQIVDTDGKASYIASAIFLKMNNMVGDSGEPVTASKLMYWFDDETELRDMDMATGIQMLDASFLIDGLHTLHYQVICSDGTITSAYSSIFLRMNIDAETTVTKSVRYWFDDEQTTTEVEITAGIQTLDASHLLDGLHTVHYQLIDNKDMPAIPMSSIFLKMSGGASESSVAKSLRYWFDDDTDVKVTSVAGGTQSLDVTGLLTGLHTLHYQLVDDKGNVCAPVSGIFLKLFGRNTASGENVITRYMYWTNDNSRENVKVDIPNPASPYNLVALLPVIPSPIRSSCFHFEVTDEEPVIYARNDLHVRFEDAQGYWVDDSRQYIDYNVSQPVKGVSELKPAQTFARPEENGIKWFRFEAAPGDTVAFKASQATTLQVFAPSGKEIYATLGDKSVVYGGTHAWEDGTYYVAVHDVTGSKSSVTLDYMHMDKYDVVDQDVRVVGNGGCGTITFQGNGFRDLYAVDLKDSNGNVIQSVDVGHENDATTTVTFDFTDARLGKYDAVFHFTGEDKTFADCITVEEAKDIELATKVTYPSTFLRGTSTTYTIEIMNKGNMTAYYVPIYTYIKSGDIKDISYVKFEGINLKNIFADIDKQGIGKEKLEQLMRKGETMGDAPYFITLKTFDEETNDSVSVRFNYFFTILPPNETKTFKLTLLSSSEVDVRITVPNDWYAYSDSISHSQNNVLRAKEISKSSVKDQYCCIVDRINCFFNVFSAGCDIASPILLALAPFTEGSTGIASVQVAAAGCIASFTNDRIESFSKTFCTSDGNPVMDFTRGILSQPTLSPGTVISCLGATLSGAGMIAKGELADALSSVADIFSYGALVNDAGNGTFDCLKDRMIKPYCPPTPPNGGTSTPINSYDPNDIYGYVAPSGSKFISEEVVTVPYRIEFENDTTFASSAAHTVIVKDTLDKKMFDLSTYQPTSIKIGDKDVQLKGDKEFVTTIDMRPEIYAIAQVEGLYDEKKGIATWRFTSLDPMTMEPTDDIMQGFLPVNHDGRGIGEVAYNIDRKPGLQDGTVIANKASIVFDSNAPILTPTWTNTVDAVPPTSRVCGIEVDSDTIVHIRFDGSDNRSGVWKYALYVQYGENTSWNQVAETDTTCFDLRYYENIDYGFCVVATDSAGNVEKKVIQREYKFLNGEGGVIDAVSLPYGEQVATDRAYDLSGRLIQEEGYRGIVIKNRKKFFKR